MGLTLSTTQARTLTRALSHRRPEPERPMRPWARRVVQGHAYFGWMARPFNPGSGSPLSMWDMGRAV